MAIAGERIDVNPDRMGRYAVPAMAPESRTCATARPRVEGKFLFIDNEKYWIKGVSYDTPESGKHRSRFSTPHLVERDFETISEIGFNTLHVRNVPPVWFLDAATGFGLRVMVGLNWEHRGSFLDDRALATGIEDRIRSGVRQCAGHPAVLAYVLGDRISPSILRWHGSLRVERFIKRLLRAAKPLDPNGLFTYLNLPLTEHLQLPFLDFSCFSLPFGSGREIQRCIASLQNLAGEKPLVTTAAETPGGDADIAGWARSCASQFASAITAGCAGTFADSWNPAAIGSTSTALARSNALAGLRTRLAAGPFSGDKDWPRVTVVICSFNGAATIRDTLDALEALEYPNYEVVVVNDGSTDATPSIAAEYDVRLFSTANRGLSNARNTGWQEATGEIVAYIDDDAYPDPHWLHYLAHTFMTTGYIGVGGPNIAPPGDGPIADCVANAPGGPVHVLLSDTEAEHIPGCNMAFRREALAAIDGFDARYRAAGDDVDLCWRLQERGWKIGFHPAAVVWHHRRNSLKMYWKQQQGYGKAEALLEEKWPEKYNALGHYSWSGRLYGKGLTEALGRPRRRLYTGHWGTAPERAGDGPSAGFLESLPLTPEWFLLIAALAVIALLGLSWAPLLWATPLLVLATAAPVGQAVLSAAKAEFPTPRPSKWERLQLRIVTAMLHLVQPVARLKGRLQHGLTPWRSRARAKPSWRLTQSHALSVGAPRKLRVWLEEIAASARRQHAVVRRGGDLDDWDLELRGGWLGRARVLFTVDDHDTGLQTLRFRCWSRLPPAGTAVVCATGILAAFAGLQGAWLAAAVLGAGALAIGVGAYRQSARTLAAFGVLLASCVQNRAAATGALAAETDTK